MSKINNYRQGDIILIRVGDEIVLNEEPLSNVLAEGEITGHKHEIMDGTVHKDNRWN